MVLALLPVIGHPAAAGLLRRLRAAALAGRARPAGLLRPLRARGEAPRCGTAAAGAAAGVTRRWRSCRGVRDEDPAGRRGHRRAHLAAARHRRRAAPARPRESRSPASAPRGASRHRWCPQAGYPLELIPPVPLPRKPVGRPAPRARPAARRREGARCEVIDRVRPDVVVGFGGYVSVPAYLAARRRHVPIVVHEGNALPGIANKLGARFTRHVATSFPGTAAAARGLHRPADPPDDLHARPGRRCAPRPGASFGLDPDRPTLLVTGGSQGARRLNQAVSGGRAPASPPPASRCCTWSARRARRRSPATAGEPPYVVLPYVDRMDLAYAAADLVVCRAGANTRHRGRRRRPARGLRAAADRQRRAGAQRPPGGRRRRRRCSSHDAALTPEWVTRHRAGPGHRRRPAGRDVRRRGLADPARRRRAAGPDRARRRTGAPPMRVPVPDELLPADRARPGALRRHRRRRPVRHRPDHARPRHHRQRQRRQGVPRPRGAARPRRPVLRRPRRRPGAAAPTRWSSRPPSGRTTPRWSRPSGSACGCCRGPRRWSR